MAMNDSPIHSHWFHVPGRIQIGIRMPEAKIMELETALIKAGVPKRDINVAVKGQQESLLLVSGRENLQTVVSNGGIFTGSSAYFSNLQRSA